LQNRAQTRGIALSRSPIVESDRKWGLTSLHTLLPVLVLYFLLAISYRA
jgi:hypothetical protein